jgi:hypothetical protein
MRMKPNKNRLFCSFLFTARFRIPYDAVVNARQRNAAKAKPARTTSYIRESSIQKGDLWQQR